MSIFLTGGLDTLGVRADTGESFLTDSKGQKWLVEIADPVKGCYLKYTDPTRDLDVVLNDIVTPSFYQISGQAPFSLGHGVTAPFTLAPKGYAYFQVSTGKLQPVPR